MGINKLKIALVLPPLLPLLPLPPLPAKILYLITPTYLYVGFLSLMLLANLTFRNIGNETDTFEAPQPPSLGEHELKVPQTWGI